MIYAFRLADGVIKIGHTEHLGQRMWQLGKDVEVLGFMPGTRAHERAIHRTLKAHRARGREYYHLTSEVAAVVNVIADCHGRPHVTPLA